MSPDEALMLDMLMAAREARMFVEGVTWEAFVDRFREHFDDDGALDNLGISSED